jgi:hypothetical protein
MPKPATRAGREHPGRGRAISVALDKHSIPDLGTENQALNRGMGKRVPAPGLAGLGNDRGAPVMPARRDAIAAIVATHNRCHKPLPHAAVRMLEAMFADDDDVCQQSREALEGATGLSRTAIQTVLRASLAAGIIAKEATRTGGGQSNRYRLVLPAEGGR